MIRADTVSKIMAYEGGEMDNDETVEFFQELYDSGLLFGLQGHYQRTFSDLLAAGLVTTNAITLDNLSAV